MFVSVVVCVLLPRFELSVAAGGVKELLRRPVALSPAPGARPVVGQVSAAAEAFAVMPGLSVSEAFARCPELKLVPPDPAAARAEWEGVVRALEALGAEVETDLDTPGAAYFKADGLRRLHGGLSGLIAAVREAVDRPLRIGVAQTRFVALAAARATRPRKARLVLTGLGRRDFLASAPVSWLEMYSGVPDSRAMADLAATLRKLGIETLGEFALLRRAEVAERFGVVGLTARDLVHGREPPLRPRRPAEVLAERIDLIDDADGQPGVGCEEPAALASGEAQAQAARPGPVLAGTLAADLEHSLQLLIERLIARPERRDRTLRGFTLSARFAEGGSWATSALMREPTADPERIKTVLKFKLAELPEPAASIELQVDAFGPLDSESTTLFGEDPARQRSRRLQHAAEQARMAGGSPQSVARVVKLDARSRLPERRAALSPGPVPLARPKPIEIRADEEGRPLLLPARSSPGERSRHAPGRRGVPVAHERERWVVEDRWWTGRPLRRRYFELVLADGRDVVVFQDLASKRWFEQRG